MADADLFLGGVIDPASGERTDEKLTYDADHLTTHGVIVGMTGSGKTGLAIGLLEETLLQGIPALVLDPKGDMGNLLLNFPSFEPSAFRPWIDEAEAQRDGITPDELAAKTATTWKDGLASWGLGPQRMTELGTKADFTIYTPGSGSGVSVNIIGDLAAPDLDWNTHSEVILDEIESYVSSLLLLAGIEADPLSTPEHILLANIIEHFWRAGQTLDLPKLIGSVQQPPMRKLGVFDVDTFIPADDRTKLAMRLNGLVASPSFNAWMQGAPLDIEAMLIGPGGKPRCAIVSLAHLSPEEQQFVTTLLLARVTTWMRRQSGTSALRALVYMDEVFGFCPPSANPPSKKPILTILKQARAFGVGLVLATQNPVDLDYKAMSNAGTWMVGRLQTERDKARILEGMQSAAGDTDLAQIDATLSGLDKRQFVLQSTRSGSQIFTTRWAMSYLAGPLTSDDIATLMVDRKTASAATPLADPAATPGATPVADAAATPTPAETVPPGASPSGATAAGPVADDETPVAPTTPDSLAVVHLDPGAPWAGEVGATAGGLRLEAAAVARVEMTFDETKADLDHAETWEAVFHPLGATFAPDEAQVVDYDDRDLRDEAPEGARYVVGDAPIDKASWWKSAQASLKEHLYRGEELRLFANSELKLYSRVGETQEGFAARCDAVAQDLADAQAAKLKDRFETKIERVQDQLVNADRRVQEIEVDISASKQNELLSGASDLLGSFLGGRSKSRGLSSIARRRGQTSKTKQRLETAQGRVADKQAQLEELEDELAEALIEIDDKYADLAGAIEPLSVGLEKTDIAVTEFRLLWLPVGP